MEKKQASSTAKLRPYKKAELAALYGISPYVFREWMKNHPELQKSKTQKIFSVKEVKKIFAEFGTPQIGNSEK